MLDGVTVGGHKQIDELITLNQIVAWKFLFTAIENKDFNLSADFVCQLQAKVAKREALTWGEFRNGGVSNCRYGLFTTQSSRITRYVATIDTKTSTK